MSRIIKVNRRLALGLAGGGVVTAGAGGLWLAIRRRARQRWAHPVSRDQPFSPSVFLAIDRAGVTTVWVTRSEMGQGVRTALPMLVAEELDADWRKVRVEQAILDGRHDYGPLLTAASASVRSMWVDLRRAGAAARAMLVGAACAAWGARARDCKTEQGEVVHLPTGRRLGYGALAEAASHERVPWRPRLKDPKDFVLLGRRVPRTDTLDKASGRAGFGLDVRLPGLRRAVVARCPYPGGKVIEVDSAKARAIPGVQSVVTIPSGVAVIADTTWDAITGRDALAVRFERPSAPPLSSEAITARLRELGESTGAIVEDRGDALTALSASPSAIEAEYATPYLAHATMEPPNCTAHVTGDRCRVWAPTQNPDGLRRMAAEICGLPESAVEVHTTYLGGGFGRRTELDEAAEAIEIARRTGHPVQVVWTRADDIRHDHFREVTYHRLRAAIDGRGTPSAWFHRLVTPSIERRSSARGEIDQIATAGAGNSAYSIPRTRVEWVSAELPLPVGIWRSIGHSFNAFAVESFLDELAAAGKRDPLDLRRALLASSPRLRACLDAAAARAGYGTARPAGRGLGVAACACFGSFVAMVAEVEVTEAGALVVERVVCAVDCGTVINPDIVEAQVEGGVAFGLSATLHGRITVLDGAVVQSNFHDYPVLRAPEMPAVEVIIMPSAEPPGGVGELAVPPVAPAVANAVYAATGRRLRELPLLLPAEPLRGTSGSRIPSTHPSRLR